jgi:probable F420-dependent oxidoreductase
MTTAVQVGRLGLWSPQLRSGDPKEVADAAAEVEGLGYGAIWIPGGAGGDVFGAVSRLLDATQRIAVATGILNVWMHRPAETAARHAEIAATHPGRFLLGLGISHAPLVDRDTPGRYQRPLEVMVEYLDGLDEATPPVPKGERALAALGPRMLTLARERTAGAHPYLVTPEHTQQARAVLGDGPLLAPEQGVVVEPDAGRARQTARAHLSVYLRLPNYTNNFLRLGFGPDDLAAGGSDRLVDAIVAWGDTAAIRARVQAHHDAGADHVCLQVLTGDQHALPYQQWRELAATLND